LYIYIYGIEKLYLLIETGIQPKEVAGDGGGK